jgi:hypothetical protein
LIKRLVLEMTADHLLDIFMPISQKFPFTNNEQKINSVGRQKLLAV